MKSSRREFLEAGRRGFGRDGCACAMRSRDRASPTQAKAQTAIPRWRGFNLLDMFTMRSRGTSARTTSSGFGTSGSTSCGFPTVYRLWIEDGDDYKIKESMLDKLDRGIELANKYGPAREPELPSRAGVLGQRGVQGAAQSVEGQVRARRLLLSLAVDGQAIQGHLAGQAQLRSDQRAAVDRQQS